MMRQYFSRRLSSSSYKNAEHFLLIEDDEEAFVGMYSPWAVLWFVIKLLVPIAYLYILLVLARELFPQHLLRAGEALSAIHFPILHQWTLASAISSIIVPKTTPATDTEFDADDSDGTMPAEQQQQQEFVFLSRNRRHGLWFWIEVWCFVEALFFIGLKIHIRWLQSLDPLEASLSAAPLMELAERAMLWKRMMKTEQENPVQFVLGWFFLDEGEDDAVAEIGAYDIRDFCAWSMFEGRHQEHLTAAELEQLEGFVRELQIRISLQLNGTVDTDGAVPQEGDEEDVDEGILSDCLQLQLPRPKKGT